MVALKKLFKTFEIYRYNVLIALYFVDKTQQISSRLHELFNITTTIINKYEASFLIMKNMQLCWIHKPVCVPTERVLVCL
jgi:hypothetical protein